VAKRRKPSHHILGYSEYRNAVASGQRQQRTRRYRVTVLTVPNNDLSFAVVVEGEVAVLGEGFGAEEDPLDVRMARLNTLL